MEFLLDKCDAYFESKCSSESGGKVRDSSGRYTEVTVD